MTEAVANGASKAGVDFATAKVALFSSSTKTRIAQLRTVDEKVKDKTIDQSTIPLLLQLLFDTHRLYDDRPSRRAAEACLASVFATTSDAKILAPFISSMRQEAQKPGISPKNAFVLVEWCSVLLQELAGKPLWDKFGLEIIHADAAALEKCLQSTTRPSVTQSALVVTRRGLRAAFWRNGLREKVIQDAVQALTAKGVQPTARNAVMLGVIAGVCSRQAQAKEVLASKKSDYFTFFTREVVGSRTPVSAHIATGLRDFFSDFVTIEDLDKDIIPPIEKGLLRAPEVVLDLAALLIRALSEKLDLSQTLNGRLLKPLLSNAKSSNATIREGALATFKAAVARSHDAKTTDQIAEEVLLPLKSGKLASADQRIIHSQMLEYVPLSNAVATKVATSLPPIAAKEGNEGALGAEVSIISRAVSYLLNDIADLPKPVIDAFTKGLVDKKIPSRRLWILQTGEVFVPFVNEARSVSANAAKFAEAVAGPLAETWTEIIKNPSAAAQSGLIMGAYVFSTLSLQVLSKIDSAPLKAILKKTAVSKECLVADPKPSFLLNHRVYSRLSTEDDARWFLRALAATYDDLSKSSKNVQAVWFQALIYLISSASVPSQIRKETCDAISKLYVRDPDFISEVAAAGLWAWIESSLTEDKDSIAASAKYENAHLHLVLKSICLNDDEFKELGAQKAQESLAKQMCSLLVIARNDLIPRASWIDLCLRVGLDPGSLAQEHKEELIQQVIDKTSFDQKSNAIKLAACNAAADLAFVAPDAITPRIIDLIRTDLATEELKEVGPVEAAIFRTPEGTAFIDVLAKKQTLPNKNTKDYDTLKWEEELRSQLAQKKGQQRKLTADEQAKVNAQLKKESEIRRSIQQLVSRLTRGFGIIRSLVNTPPTEPNLWIGPSISALLSALESGAGLITGDAGPTAYLACSDRVTPRLGAIRPFIGVATLRALEITSLPDNLTEEGLEELITRVLYRLRFAGEQRPFDAVSVIYMLSLIFVILRTGGIGAGADEKDAQLVLAIEFLTSHTHVCADESIPRADLISILTTSMQRYSQHYKIIKDCFTDMVRCVAPNINADEIAVLAKGAIVPQDSVRETVLQSISAEVDMSDLDFSEEIWIACHDDIPEIVELGHEIWEESGFELSKEVPFQMLPYLESKDAQLRRAAARSLAEACKDFPATIEAVLTKLRASYVEFAKPRVPQLDEYGMPRKTDLSDPWEARHGIGAAFRELAAYLQKSQIDDFFNFLIEGGPLGDQNATVRSEMLEAALVAIDLHGRALVDKLMKTFERTLGAPDKGSEAADRVNEAVIVMYGALARHLKPGDAKIPVVLERLLATLSTPSEAVQYAVAECLPPLVRTCGDKSSKYFDQLIDILLTSKKYAEKRGAAYGLAGLVQGRGISVLREYRILITLKSATENRKEPQQREGAYLAFELFASILGRVFEPYVIQIVPQLLAGFGDSNADVRDACLAAAKACFAKLSSYGVKQILPTLLNGLDDDQWRSKRGACDLLGAMAYLDPQQLAQSLPDIIPPLTGVLNDSHKEVRAAANKSLKRFGEVIENPEVKGLVDILLKALSDPTKYTDDALDSLIKVQFVHYLDAPSLALVTRILQRGLGDRSNTKRKASQVIGSLAHLTERKDLIAHLPVLVSGLKLAAVDPVPTTRATASRALGSLVEKLGEDALPDLIPGLMQTLKSDTGAGDRLGSAQALSEVLAGLGTTRLEETLPTILQNVESSKPAVREGFMSLFIFLPVCFGNSFANYLGKIIPPILAGLADDIESIRETALRAGRLLVKNFAARAVDLLLPELERGLADDSYRIRLSSVELVGDLLFNLTGITGKADAEDEEESAKEAGASLREVLGEEKRNKILSALYICRCDTASAVRAAAVSVWKALVATPRTLKELTPTLTQLIIRRLGSSNMEHKVIASNALGELIRKAGDGVLSSLLPTLEEGLQTSTDTNARQGICLALKELISSASEEALQDHEKTLISVVRTALTDSDEDVREAAAEAFDSLQQIIGKRAVDQVLPFLLNLLRSEEEADNALSALLTLLTETTRSNIILPNLIPTLIAPPISAFNAKALASLARVAGPAMNRRLPNIVNSLMDNIVNTKDEELRVDLEESFDTVILSIDEYDGLNTVMNVLLQLVKNDDHNKRAVTASRLAKFFANASVDYSRYNQDIIRALLISFDDRDKEVVKAAWTALSEFTKKLKKEEMEALVQSTRQTLLQVGVAGTNLPGFELPKGINAILPIFLQGLMNGTAEQRTSAALAISDIVDRTSEASLKPFVTQITGPLIRVVSERSTDVKAAILLTLNNLLEKMPTALKPFLPQLQRTFARALADTTSDLLRSRAAKALGTLIKFTPRVDPLISELVTGSKTSDPGVKTAMLKALYEVISKAGSNMGESSRTAVLGLIDLDTDTTDSTMTVTNAKLLGALIKNVPPEAAHGLLKNRVATTHFTNASVLALNAVFVESPQTLLESPLAEDLPDLLCQGMSNKNLFVADNSILATGKYLLTDSPKSFESTKPIFSTLATIIGPGNPSDSRRLALVIVRTVSRANLEMVRPHLPLLAPPVFASVRDPVIPVKLAAEAAFIELFSVVDEESKVFEKYVAGAGADLPANTKRSMQDYFKRVAVRLGNQARERRDAEGGQGGLGLSNDEVEDEKEIWSVGSVEIGGGVFSHD
ncbi:translational activator GCN1 [Annulohypoxylon truncatum]|uniref:translational activator GCN1 n=1 Tax=Annulohypoxylon truncatum TaxID=327061 RepID=UPI0020084CB3|nr:translational activator GCN1 [Annulohypoxylon truncatum]KAI1204428.1 translational activator GCN1 [Annulohypoxylon truncatum]